MRVKKELLLGTLDYSESEIDHISTMLGIKFDHNGTVDK
ncbi:hypothetical protein CFELI_12250 [Corynebacterium felinum]|uniref:Uncharacterized protein n=1 Tax=Corynebacterium felinum TaxID=131318 RepID=A0ABU2B645_9CORY|nr:hypothetical protein [Corynebacterium felinum]WJY96031.1 hypothetical protein CFELI_12250 [Corynebacterium felinum]